MGQQIIRQPNGKFAVFSTIVDSLVGADLTRKQLVERLDARAHADNVRHVREVTQMIAKGKPAYFQFTMTWDEAVAATEGRDSEDGD